MKSLSTYTQEKEEEYRRKSDPRLLHALRHCGTDILGQGRDDLRILHTLQQSGIDILVEDGGDERIFVARDYSIATHLYIPEKPFRRHPELPRTGKWVIHFTRNIKIPEQYTPIHIHCRHEQWGEEDMHLAVWNEDNTRKVDDHGNESYKPPSVIIHHPQSIETLSLFYRDQGVSDGLLEAMAKKVQELRAQQPAGTYNLLSVFTPKEVDNSGHE